MSEGHSKLEPEPAVMSRVFQTSGYAMAGLLAGIAVMGILMSMIFPSWRMLVKREKEAELVFRGEQYMRAVELYQRRFPGAYPADLETLVEQRFLRRLYDDPMTGKSFEILRQGSAGVVPGPGGTATGVPGTPRPGMLQEERQIDVAGTRQSRPRGERARSGFDAGQVRRNGSSESPFRRTGDGLGDGLGGIIGVVSQSTDQSMRFYNGRDHYNEWLFAYTPQSAEAGLGAQGLGAGGSQDLARPEGTRSRFSEVGGMQGLGGRPGSARRSGGAGSRTSGRRRGLDR